MNSRAPRTLLALAVLAGVGHAARADPPQPDWTIGIGAAMERLPAWPGSAGTRTLLEPYLAVSLMDRVDFSTLDGLAVDLIHGVRWHGGLYADYLQGRSGSDLAQLAGRIDTVPFAILGGGWLACDLTAQLEGGVRLLRDVARPGALGEAYLAWELPAIGHFSQSFELTARAADRTMQQRWFGVAEDREPTPGMAPYRAGGGWQRFSLGYTATLPVTTHLALAASAEFARLTGAAAASPLVRTFGSREQRSFGIALVYGFPL